jgi:UDP-3-O-[3-hydroxymyristoyl] glucosamine N-acyltransferase
LHIVPTVGQNVKIEHGACIGQDGFRYDRNPITGILTELPHKFGVIIEDNVRVGAGATIDRGRWRDTVIRRGTKIDNCAHVAHNAIIGEDCLIHAFVNICGSVEIGNRCEIFPHCNISPGVKICDDVIIGSNSFVKSDITEKGTYVGCPVRKIK